MNEQVLSPITGFTLYANTQGGSEMVKATNESLRYQTQLTNGMHSILSDTTRNKGGSADKLHEYDDMHICRKNDGGVL